MDAAELQRWRENGSMDVFHYGAGRDLPIGYGLLEDAAKYESYPNVRQPTLIFHGTQDRSVPIAESAHFCELHSNATLVRLESGHELTDVLDVIWKRSKDFLQLVN
jgi:pimeloyl-ACP methyl ester carboxylesterase